MNIREKLTQLRRRTGGLLFRWPAAAADKAPFTMRTCGGEPLPVPRCNGNEPLPEGIEGLEGKGGRGKPAGSGGGGGGTSSSLGVITDLTTGAAPLGSRLPASGAVRDDNSSFLVRSITCNAQCRRRFQQQRQQQAEKIGPARERTSNLK